MSKKNKKNKKSFTNFFREGKNKKSFTNFFREGISCVLGIPSDEITDESIYESIKSIKEIKFDVKRIKRKTIKCENCYSDLLEDISNIEDLDYRGEMFNEFCQKLQEITKIETTIEMLRNWRKAFNKKQQEDSIIPRKCCECSNENNITRIPQCYAGNYRGYGIKYKCDDFKPKVIKDT